MGVNVNLYAKGSVSDAELATAEAFMVERFGGPGYGDVWLAQLGPDDYFEDGGERIEFCCLSRYYGVGYERGTWPTIYGYIRAMKAAFPNLPIHYGGASDDYATPATDAQMDYIWQHWLSPQGMDYRRECERWNAAQAARP